MPPGPDPGASAAAPAAPVASRPKTLQLRGVSPAGQTAYRYLQSLKKKDGKGFLYTVSGDGNCVNTPDCADEVTPFHDPDGPQPAGTRSEVSLAADATGKHVVVGFNDFRGFANMPPSVSGFMYSDDGGATFKDGGQLPAAGSAGVFGDPDVKYLGGCNFVYSSILFVDKTVGMMTVTESSMGIHRSTDCGHTWQGPFEVTGATDPNNFADKEFIDVDPDTGRVLMSWTAFTPMGAQMSVTYSDNVLSATPPTWSSRVAVSGTPEDGQGSVPRFAGNGSKDAYVVWTRFPFPGVFKGFGNQIAFSRSTDNGVTWGAPITLDAEFFTMDHVLGNDRVHTFSSMAVDNSKEDNKGNIYVVYANNNNHDGADIYIQRSEDGGQTFSPPLALNSRPGADRAQWFPFVTVDKKTGRVYVFFYDQGIAESGDLTENTFTYSDDGGQSWSPPAPLSARPFHAGWGNDTSQPNLGDYIGGTAQGGELFAVFAATHRPPGGFVDGQPSAQMTVPEPFFHRTGAEDCDAPCTPTNTTPLAINGVSFTESGGNGNIDPGDKVSLKISLRNYVTNLINAQKLHVILATLSTHTAGVKVLHKASFYPHLSAGASGTNLADFVLKIQPGFVPGTPIELELKVHTLFQGAATLHHTLFTGTPQATTLLSENFDGVAPGALPMGWSAKHGGGANVVPWTTQKGFCGSMSNAAFHADAIDGPPMGDPTRWERLWSPLIDVPAKSDWVDLEFDVCYNTEDDPNFNILAYDGFFLRVFDATMGHTARSVLVEAYEDEFTTGSINHYPKHLPRGGGAYFEDMSAWAGNSGGVKHVHLRLPGMAGTKVQLRFEYTQDAAGTCVEAGHGPDCGVSLDNIVMKNVVAVKP